MSTVREVAASLEEIAPTRFAAEWDNVGLLVGDPASRVTRALLAIDYTRAVAEEADALGAEMVVAYHPPIFKPLRRVVAGTLVFEALVKGRAIYAPHTALDVAEGGTNDVLASILGLEAHEPLRPLETRAKNQLLVVFSPKESVEAVSRALFEAGAGRVGRYRATSFRAEGKATFLPEGSAEPASGKPGELSEEDEVRVETVVPLARVADVLSALRRAHPYEEPAFDLLPLAAPPEHRGFGRVGTLPEPAERGELLERIKAGLGAEALLVAGPRKGLVRRVACCAGACGDHLGDAIARGAELYLTGELRHHDALAAAERGVTVVCALHSVSERRALEALEAELEKRVPDLDVRVSRADRDPFSFV